MQTRVVKPLLRPVVAIAALVLAASIDAPAGFQRLDLGHLVGVHQRCSPRMGGFPATSGTVRRYYLRNPQIHVRAVESSVDYGDVADDFADDEDLMAMLMSGSGDEVRAWPENELMLMKTQD